MDYNLSDDLFAGTMCLFFGLAFCVGLIELGMWIFKKYLGWKNEG
jgi:hypothetical protein